MIQLRTILKPADNSGAKRLRVIHIHVGFKHKSAHIGDIVTCAVDRADPKGQVQDSQLVKAVIVRTRKEYRRADGSYIKFDDNAVIILESKEPKGTRIFGPVARELREKGFTKIISLVPEVL